MITSFEPVSVPCILDDPTDPRYQEIVGLRRRFGTFLHNASKVLQCDGESALDPIQVLVRCSGCVSIFHV